MEKEIKNVFRNGNQDEVLSEAFRLTITRKDIQTLNHLNWLNDEVILCLLCMQIVSKNYVKTKRRHYLTIPQMWFLGGPCVTEGGAEERSAAAPPCCVPIKTDASALTCGGTVPKALQLTFLSKELLLSDRALGFLGRDQLCFLLFYLS